MPLPHSPFSNEKDSQKERVFVLAVLCLAIAFFFAFGLFHLGKFETTDEHLWKYDRIGQYWQALADQEWEKTYINDKPGITVALISGIGLLAEPHPERNEKISQSGEQEKLFETYDARQSEITNIHFRLPVLVFSTLSLFLFFWLLLRAFHSYWIALFSTLFIATNLILLGMSQIINPDSFFWVFGGLAIIAYIALQNTHERKFLLLCGILTGFALLSKYTAFILFLFYAIFLATKIIFQPPEIAKTVTFKTLGRYILDIGSIFLLALMVFSFFLPAVLAQPEYLFKGIAQFLDWKNSALYLGGIAIMALVWFYFRNRLGDTMAWLASKRHLILTFILTLFLILSLISIINVWTGQKLAPVELLRDTAYANEPKEFNFKPLFDRKENTLQNSAQLFLMEAYPFIFSISPLYFLILLFVLAQSVRKKIPDNTAALIASVLLFTLLYFLSTLSAKVVTNARYLIILYPLFAILSAVSLAALLEKERTENKNYFRGGALLILMIGLVSVWTIRPFYFSYTNFLLPQSFSIHDSWGHGSYEAAQYLNSLENPSDLIIWSNSDTVCRFFQGQCLKSRRIDLSRVTPDFFVISKRGAIKTSNRFLLTNNPHPEKDSDYYFQKLDGGFVWELSLNNRPGNFIKIIPFEK